MEYRGFEIEKYHNGYIVTWCGDEIYCETIPAAEKQIDEFLESEDY